MSKIMWETDKKENYKNWMNKEINRFEKKQGIFLSAQSSSWSAAAILPSSGIWHAKWMSFPQCFRSWEEESFSDEVIRLCWVGIRIKGAISSKLWVTFEVKIGNVILLEIAYSEDEAVTLYCLTHLLTTQRMKVMTLYCLTHWLT